MLPSLEHPDPAETAKGVTRSQRDALRAIAFFRRQRKAGKGWLVGNKRLSEKLGRVPINGVHLFGGVCFNLLERRLPCAVTN